MKREVYYKPRVGIRPYFKWYDLWVGIYIERYENPISFWPGGFAVFIGLFPTIGIQINVYYRPHWK